MSTRAQNGNGRASSNGAASPREPDHEIAVIGSGFGGIGAAIKLLKAGLDDLVILEGSDDIGGTWRDNDYPGLAVDIPSFSYQYSFEMNPDWSRVFASGAEVKAYADHCVDKYGLRERIRFNSRVTKLVWDEDNHLWKLHIGRRIVRARFVVSSFGGLTQPKLPEIPGIDEFEGKLIHTAYWDHDHDLTGERVAMIGTGATAVQLLPKIARKTEQMYVYQRTPIWVLPKPDAKIPRAVRAAFRYLPGLQNSIRLSVSAAVEVGMVVGVVYNRQLPGVVKSIEALGRAFIRTQVSDPELREKLTPQYGFGCKRPSMSNVYHRTFTRDNVELITEPIEAITKQGIRTADGVEHEIDTLICATGYLTTEPENAPSTPIFGKGGRSLRDVFAEERFQAYEGVSNPGFPNAFAVFGPYAFTGSSWMFMVENQSDHVIRVIKEAKRRGASATEIRQGPHDDFFEEMLRRQQNTIFFNNNCGTANSYYFDQHGDAPFLRPSTAIEAWWRAHHFDLDNYRYQVLEPAAVAHANGNGRKSAPIKLKAS